MDFSLNEILVGIFGVLVSSGVIDFILFKIKSLPYIGLIGRMIEKYKESKK